MVIKPQPLVEFQNSMLVKNYKIEKFDKTLMLVIAFIFITGSSANVFYYLNVNSSKIYDLQNAFSTNIQTRYSLVLL